MKRRRHGGRRSPLIVHYRGRKGVKDETLAKRCGFTDVEQMYRVLGQKLLLLPRSCWFELPPAKRSGKEQDPARPVMVFTLSGVIMVAAWLATECALEVSIALAPLLRTRRRASKNKQRRPSRADDPKRQTQYEGAVDRLHSCWVRLDKKIELSIRPGRR